MTKNIEATGTYFAPQLTLRNVLAGMVFYQRAFGAIELRRWSNPNGSVHVAEMAIEGAMFHLHEERPGSGTYLSGNAQGNHRDARPFCGRPGCGREEGGGCGWSSNQPGSRL